MKSIWVVVLVLLAFGAGYGLHRYRFGERPHAADDDDLDDDDDDGDDDEGVEADVHVRGEHTKPSPGLHSEVVERMHIQREAGYLYFLRGTDVWRTPLKRAGTQPQGGGLGLVARGHFTRDDGYLYFLDVNGDVARVKRAVR